ncbi:hypothetical protein ABPG72_015120 [Tetrahymena utriculariae]
MQQIYQGGFFSLSIESQKLQNLREAERILNILKPHLPSLFKNIYIEKIASTKTHFRITWRKTEGRKRRYIDSIHKSFRPYFNVFALLSAKKKLQTVSRACWQLKSPFQKNQEWRAFFRYLMEQINSGEIVA